RPTRDLPAPLRAAVVENARWEAPFILAAARKGAKSADAAYVAGCLFRATGLLAHALHAHAGTYVLNEKGALHAAATLPTTPRGLTPRAQSLFTRLGTTPQTLHAALDDAEALVAEVSGGGGGWWVRSSVTGATVGAHLCLPAFVGQVVPLPRFRGARGTGNGKHQLSPCRPGAACRTLFEVTRGTGRPGGEVPCHTRPSSSARSCADGGSQQV
ncbi:hypothetical protein GA0115246_113781, partial [Streptomyces sp. SolWspMP-sol7th]